MALAESKVPPWDRSLIIQGRVREDVLRVLRPGLPPSWPPHSVPLWVGYSYADLSLGTVFTRLFPFERPAGAVQTSARAIAVTQEYSKPFEEIPHGIKTVTVFEFPTGVPSLIGWLPDIGAWGGT